MSGEPTAARILVADDDDLVRRLIVLMLKNAGYEVDFAEDGQTAWDALASGGYDLLITDHEMPRMSGLNLIKKLRRAGLDLAIIFASATLPQEELDRNAWLNIAGAVSKPFSVAEMLTLVDKALLDRHHTKIYNAP